MDAIILGVSPDSAKSHQGFIAKYGLKITLLSDPEHKIMADYGVWQQKKLYGKDYWGVERSTFIIDPEGNLAYAWRNVKVPGHADEVKQRLFEIQHRDLGVD